MDHFPRKIFSSRPRWQALFRNADTERRTTEAAAIEEEALQTFEPHDNAALTGAHRSTTYIDNATQTSPGRSNFEVESSSLAHPAGPTTTSSVLSAQEAAGPDHQSSEAHTVSEEHAVSIDDCQETNALESGPSEQHHDTGDSLGFSGLEEAESEDARRALACVFFVNEEEEDYTTGLARVVSASDGVKEDASALLLTLDFSARVRKAVLAQRSFRAFEAASDERKCNLMDLERDIKKQVNASEYLLCKADPQDQDTQKTAQQLSNIRLLLEDVKLRQQQNDAQLRTQAKVLRTCQTNALTILEEAFVIAGLVPEPTEEQEAEGEPYDLQTEYQNFVRDLEGGSEDDSQVGSTHSIAMLEIAGDDFMQTAPPPVSPEAQRKHDAKEAFYEARQNLLEAQVRFDRKEEDQAQARHGEQEIEDDEEIAAFDLHWFQRNREITRELIEAEEQLAKAKAEALALGVEIRLEDQASGFSAGEDEEEGSLAIRESWEGEATAAHFSRTKVDEWLGSVDEQSSSEHVGDADTDDWDAQEVEISESRSLVAWGPPRKKIDKWQQDCRERG
ncbi:hypothetical protein CKM354_000417000 [Cercospora kikuchii]|uniref:Uncharacterized protein n=1 Tax=Cercospora kikuchii TaxID=84275 RepID=A0A9P3FED7_9PEZI|nr:uncharacterized protein CKM354_000417000 [Cercospora kikuchii]GIZ40847.1 hypothetical protein CKM354_000417000 [Cercospora kikuchii]